MATNTTWGKALFSVIPPQKTERTIQVAGRDRWALEALVKAGDAGCTPIDTPGPRWSGYVHNLRNLGVPIETITEPHDGPFSGTHARYVLQASVTRLSEGDALWNK